MKPNLMKLNKKRKDFEIEFKKWAHPISKQMKKINKTIMKKI